MDTKDKGKSKLNPNAAPFVPFSRSVKTNPNPPLVEDKRYQHVPEEAQGSTDLATEYRLPDVISFDYEEGMTDEQRVVENISTMYPEIPRDFIDEFAGAHGYDFDLTVDMLEQFYVCQTLQELSYSLWCFGKHVLHTSELFNEASRFMHLEKYTYLGVN